MQTRASAKLTWFLATLVLVATFGAGAGQAASPPLPAPLLEKGHPVDWWFVFKFNAKSFPKCGKSERACPFGGDVQTSYQSFGQQYIYASSEHDTLTKGVNCAGDTTADPVGATFDEVYNGMYFYVIWNDQFYDDPKIKGCTKECSAPWGHSKGLLVWDNAGNGFVLQVSTPSWPASGSRTYPRRSDGNSLGCVKDDNVKVSQHFFALHLTEGDVEKVLAALANASVVTDVTNRQIVHNGGPQKIQDLVSRLGKKSLRLKYSEEKLSTGVTLISKPSHLHVPPWQMVSALLGGVSLRTATWWANPKIYTTTDSSPIACWDDSLGKPGAVEIATSGQWEGTRFGLKGGSGPNFNHAKFGISISGSIDYVIFGDMNQQGSISPNERPCTSSQNGRGGTFYVFPDKVLWNGLRELLSGATAPTGASQ